MNFCIFSKNIKNFIEREFYDLKEYHFIKIQHFYFKKMKRNLVNITEDLFWCSGQGWVVLQCKLHSVKIR